MSISEKDLISQKVIVEFTLPRLHRGKQWYVDFFCFDPVRNRMRRKKYMLDRIKAVKDREKMASILIHNLFEKLKNGWNPYSKARTTRHYTEWLKIVQHYKDYLDAFERKGTLKHKTAVDYRSRLKQLELYIEESGNQLRYVYQFDRSFAIDFLDYLVFDKDVSAKTRNNYRTWLSTFSTWLIDRQYIEVNPIDGIHMMKELEKFRDAMTPESLARLRDYTLSTKPAFYLACMMEYYTFIRPDELRYVKVGDISVKEQTILIHADNAKNRKAQVVAINDALLKEMIRQGVFNHPSSDYLFGSDLKPGPEQTYINRFRIEWKKVREALHFPDSYQFYSLKDSGIRDLANAEGIVVARDQARHSDVAVTNRYLKVQKGAHEETKHYKGEL